MLTEALLGVVLQAAPLFTADRDDPSTVDGGLSRGVAFGDADGDGDPDLLVANTINYPEFLYRNDSGRFVQVMELAPSLAGGYSEGVSWVDYDNDGDLDLFVARTGGADALYRNDGDWIFSAVDAGQLTSRRSPSSMACWADFDNDGRLDVFVVHRDGENDGLYRNDGNGRFVPVAPAAPAASGGNGRTCAAGDADNDGDPDLFVGNFIDTSGDSPEKEANFFYVNEGGFDFRRVHDSPITASKALTYGASWADVDDDGDLDLFVTNIGRDDRNELFLSDGNGGFSPAGAELGSGAPSKGHAWGDYDLDGDLDLAIANGTEGSESIANFLYLNDGGEAFAPVTQGAFVADRHISAGIAWADVDGDGALDLYVANWAGSDEDNDLYRGRANGSWLLLQLLGKRSNRMGIGAKVTAAWRDETGHRRIYRWMLPQTGYASQNEAVVHIGARKATELAELTIDWPSGQRDTHRDVATKRRLVATEGGSLADLSAVEER